MPKVLIIDDDSGCSYVIQRVCNKQGYDVCVASDAASGISLARQVQPDVIFLDVRLPDGSGLDCIRELKALSSSPEIIVNTAFGDSAGARMALEYGAWQYVQKDMPLNQIRSLLERALRAKGHKDREPKPEEIIGESWLLRQSVELAHRYAKTDSSVLITGETGTGKDIFARYIHRCSSRKNAPFVTVDCAGITDNLAGSILFGHEKGAFTNAVSSHSGLFSEAEGGTLFLDELGELPLQVQKIFLRVLQERSYRPVGGNREYPCNIRIIAATNKNITEMIQNHTFRSDLFYRVQSCLLNLPPLRNREDDVLLLAQYFLGLVCRQKHIREKLLSDEIKQFFREYLWAGNVRELQNVITYAVIMAEDEAEIYIEHLPMYMRISRADSLFSSKETPQPLSAPQEDAMEQIDWNDPPTLGEYRDNMIGHIEKYYLENLLRHRSGELADFQKISGLSRSRFYGLLKKYKLHM